MEYGWGVRVCEFVARFLGAFGRGGTYTPSRYDAELAAEPASVVTCMVPRSIFRIKALRVPEATQSATYSALPASSKNSPLGAEKVAVNVGVPNPSTREITPEPAIVVTTRVATFTRRMRPLLRSVTYSSPAAPGPASAYGRACAANVPTPLADVCVPLPLMTLVAPVASTTARTRALPASATNNW